MLEYSPPIREEIQSANDPRVMRTPPIRPLEIFWTQNNVPNRKGNCRMIQSPISMAFSIFSELLSIQIRL